MIPVPIIEGVSLDEDGTAVVFFWHDTLRGAHLPDVTMGWLQYVMVDGDPTRLEVVE